MRRCAWRRATIGSLSMNCIVLETVGDGDCGLDVLNMIIGGERRLEARQALRQEMAKFLLKHVGNRALIAMLHDLGEISKHLGRFELESEAAKLLEDSHGDGRGDGAALAHGDGAAAAGPSGVADRTFTAEEVVAVKWKCRLHKASPEGVQRILVALPDNIIKHALQEYEHREAPKPPARGLPCLLLSRDCKVPQKVQAAEHFLEFCKTMYGAHRGDGVQQLDPKTRGNIQEWQSAARLVCSLHKIACGLRETLPPQKRLCQHFEDVPARNQDSLPEQDQAIRGGGPRHTRRCSSRR